MRVSSLSNLSSSGVEFDEFVDFEFSPTDALNFEFSLQLSLQGRQGGLFGRQSGLMPPQGLGRQGGRVAIGVVPCREVGR